MHAAPNNHSEAKRVAWFIGYSCVFFFFGSMIERPTDSCLGFRRYRWLRARDEMTVGGLMPLCGPIRRQLLTAGPCGGMGRTSPELHDLPLRQWAEAHVRDGGPRL